MVERAAAEVTDEHVDEVLKQHPRAAGRLEAGRGRRRRRTATSSSVRDPSPGRGRTSPPRRRTTSFLLGRGRGDPRHRDRDPDAGARRRRASSTSTSRTTSPTRPREEHGERVRDHAASARRSWSSPTSTTTSPDRSGDFETLDGADARRSARTWRRTRRSRPRRVVRGRLLDLLRRGEPLRGARSRWSTATPTPSSGTSAKDVDRRNGWPKSRERSAPRPSARSKRILVIDRVAETAGPRRPPRTRSGRPHRGDRRAERHRARRRSTPACRRPAGSRPLEREITERKVFDFLKAQSEITDAPAT